MNTYQLLDDIRDRSPAPDLRAAITYILRQARYEHPAGTFDAARRWYPALSEGIDLLGLRAPSRKWPFSLMHGARTAKHCAHLHGADVVKVRRIARQIKAAGNDASALRDCFPPEDAAGILDGVSGESATLSFPTAYDEADTLVEKGER